MARRHPTIVIDTGTSTAKAGFSSDTGPQLEVPTLVRVPKPSGDTLLTAGKVAEPMGDDLDLVRPMKRGIVTNFSHMTKLWSDIFDKLGVSSPSEYAVFLTDRDLTPKANKEKTTQIMFEEFQVASLSFAVSSACSIIGSGRLCGTAASLGGVACVVAPVQYGYALPHATRFLNLAGDDITEYLMTIINRERTVVNSDIARCIKESMAYISQDFLTGVSQTQNTSYALPDGQLVDIGAERHACTEPLFSPALMGREEVGLHRTIMCAFEAFICSKHDKYEKYIYNLILSGGTSLLPGIKERLQRELSPLLPPGLAPSYTLLPHRKYLAWQGASIISSMSSFGVRTYTSEEYDESGPGIVHCKVY